VLCDKRHAVSLEIVLGLTLYARAIARSDPPSSRRRMASSFWCGVSFGLRPRLLSSALARRAALAGADADKLALELGKASEDG
jgi:hypothetical protein